MDSFVSAQSLSIGGAPLPGEGVPDSAAGGDHPRSSGSDPGSRERPQAGLAPTPPALTLHALSSALASSVPEVCSDCRSVWQKRLPTGEELDQIALRVQETLRRFREQVD